MSEFLGVLLVVWAVSLAVTASAFVTVVALQGLLRVMRQASVARRAAATPAS